MNAINRYVGIPQADHGRGFDGCDCWGLCRLILSEQCGLDLPSYAEGYTSATERDEIALLLAEAEFSGVWLAVSRPREFDLVTFRVQGQRAHLGLMVDAKRFIHIHGRDAAKIVRLDHERWAQRVLGFFRHEALA